jgi:hypothetical protein
MGKRHLSLIAMDALLTQDTLYGLGCGTNFTSGHYIDITPTIYNDLATFIFIFNVSVKDSSSPPIFSSFRLY